MKKEITQLFIGLLCLSFTFVNAQQDVNSPDPDPAATITPNPVLQAPYLGQTYSSILKSASAVYYTDGIQVAVEFAGVAPTSVTLSDATNAANNKTSATAAGQALFFGVSPNRNFEIRAYVDGQFRTIGTLSTSPYSIGAPIEVSEALYSSLSKYVTPAQQTTKLSDYLLGQSQISLIEKTAFVQKYFLKGVVLPASIRGQYPSEMIKQSVTQSMGEGDCLCNFVVKNVAFANPDAILGDYDIQDVSYSSGFNFYNSASYRYRGSKYKGPAKDQFLNNAGQLAGNKRRNESWSTGEEGSYNSYASMSYHFLCLNFNQLPSNCACEKQVKFSFGYNTSVEATSNTGGPLCILEQDAAARSQDWAVALLTREKQNDVNDVQIFAANSALAESSCNGGVPVGVVLDAISIGKDLIQILKGVKSEGIGSLFEALDEIIGKLGNVLTQITAIQDCSNAIVENVLFNNSTVVTMQPNDPITFLLISGSNMSVSGVRCWDSTAKIKSSFHLTGLLLGGYPNESDLHCCSDYVAQWLFASQRGDDSSLQNAISGYLGLNGPSAWHTVNGQSNPSGSLNISTRIGDAFSAPFPNGNRCPARSPGDEGTPR